MARSELTHYHYRMIKMKRTSVVPFGSRNYRKNCDNAGAGGGGGAAAAAAARLLLLVVVTSAGWEWEWRWGWYSW